MKALETISVPGHGQNMVESGAIKNVLVFGDEVVVDVTIDNPTYRQKKRQRFLFCKPFIKKFMRKHRLK
ncbi:septum site-determining protein MinD [Nonlabens ulvanivorans]|nr:septum site-determining protein MinD [Nonlabens ulvanivorans]